MISLALVSVHTVDENKNSHVEKLDCFRLDCQYRSANKNLLLR